MQGGEREGKSRHRHKGVDNGTRHTAHRTWKNGTVSRNSDMSSGLDCNKTRLRSSNQCGPIFSRSALSESTSKWQPGVDAAGHIDRRMIDISGVVERGKTDGMTEGGREGGRGKERERARANERECACVCVRERERERERERAEEWDTQREVGRILTEGGCVGVSYTVRGGGGRYVSDVVPATAAALAAGSSPGGGTDATECTTALYHVR
jgi:hypothetical protein